MKECNFHDENACVMSYYEAPIIQTVAWTVNDLCLWVFCVKKNISNFPFIVLFMDVGKDLDWFYQCKDDQEKQVFINSIPFIILLPPSWKKLLRPDKPPFCLSIQSYFIQTTLQTASKFYKIQFLVKSNEMEDSNASKHFLKRKGKEIFQTHSRREF